MKSGKGKTLVKYFETIFHSIIFTFISYLNMSAQADNKIAYSFAERIHPEYSFAQPSFNQYQYVKDTTSVKDTAKKTTSQKMVL